MNTPLSRILRNCQKPLFRLQSDELQTVRGTLDTVETRVKQLRGARRDTLSAAQRQAFDEAHNILSPAVAGLILADQQWHEEINQFVTEARRTLDREERRRKIAPVLLPETAWKAGKRVVVKLTEGYQPFVRQNGSQGLDGLKQVETIFRDLVRRHLPPEYDVWEVRAELLEAPSSRKNQNGLCSVAIDFLRNEPDFMRLTYRIGRENDQASRLQVEAIVEAPFATDTNQLIKDWLNDPEGPVHKLGKAAAGQAGRIPWRSFGDLVKAIQTNPGGPTHMLAELGFFRAGELERLSKNSSIGQTINKQLPRLVECSPWPIARKYTLPLAKALHSDEATRALILQALIGSAEAAAAPDLLATDVYLVEAASSLAGKNRTTDFAQALVAFFKLWNWSPELSQALHPIIQNAMAPNVSLGSDLEALLVQQAVECLRKASRRGELAQALHPLAALLKLEIFSQPAKGKLLEAAGAAVTTYLPARIPPVNLPGTWLTKGELAEFLEALQALRLLGGAWDFAATWEAWVQWLPRRDQEPLRYPASLAPLARAWLLSPGTADEWPLFPYLSDLVGWLVRTRLEDPHSTTGPGSFDNALKLGAARLKTDDQMNLIRLGVGIIAANIERSGTLDESHQAALCWIVANPAGLLEATKATVRLAPWRYPVLRTRWQGWFVEAWSDSNNGWRLPLVEVVLKAWMVCPEEKEREEWNQVLQKDCLFRELVHDCGSHQSALRKVMGAAAVAGQDNALRQVMAQYLSHWVGRNAVYEAAVQFCNDSTAQVSFSLENRLCLLFATLSNPTLRGELLEIFGRYPQAVDLALDDAAVQNSLVKILEPLGSADGKASVMDELLINRLQRTCIQDPLKTWRRIKAAKRLLGSPGVEMLPVVYRSLAPGLLTIWLEEANRTAIQEFATDCGTALLPIGRSLVIFLADQVLVATPADWSKLREKTELLYTTLAQLQLSSCYESVCVKKVIHGRLLPPETGRLLLVALFCSPALIARNMMDDVAWHAAAVHRLTDKSAAAALTALALDEQI